ncbi:MAG TPA: SET domain-containing protein-lysine N-methyltransferase [Kineosporiaceae bacterium]
MNESEVRVAVMRYAKQFCLVAKVQALPGDLLFTIDGKLTRVPTSHSVQIDRDIHIDLPEGYTHAEIMDRFFWRYMNHSCDPTAVVCGREVFALRPLAPGQEVSFDYHTTEYELAESFSCHCGSPRCLGQIRGFRFLAAEDRQRLRPWVADHLLDGRDDPEDSRGEGGWTDLCR